MVGDYVQPILVLIRNYNILIPIGNVWMNHNWWFDYADQVWFTDGSKQTGAGVFGPRKEGNRGYTESLICVWNTFKRHYGLYYNS